MGVLCGAKAGITRLSELIIDADKNWQGKGISNIKQVAEGMEIGHIIQHNGSILETLPPEVANYVLTSEGPGHKVTWAPGGMYLYRFFPVSIELLFAAGLFTPDHLKQINAPIASPFGNIYGIPEHNTAWFRKQEPSIALSKAAAIYTPDHSEVKTPIVGSQPSWQVPVGGAVADDGGVQTDETAQAKSGPAVDQQYNSGDDGNRGMTSSSIWEGQAFQAGANYKLRYVRLKLYRTGKPGTSVVRIRNTSGGLPTGGDLTTQNFNGNALTEDTNGRWEKIWLDTPIDITNGTTYALIVSTGDEGNVYWRCDASSPTYANGSRVYSSNAGVGWAADTTRDFMFEVYGTVNDMTLLPASLAVDDAYYFGHGKKFSVVEIDIGQAGAGTYVLAWEYWNGATWAGLVDLDDGTNAFKNSWTNEVSHTPQGDWALTTIQGMNLYWIRARVTDVGIGYSQPLGTWADVRTNV